MQFVAHPHCQQMLASVWYAGIPGWRRYNFAAKFIIIVTLIGLLPIMAFIYLLVPRSRIGRFVRRPFMKFMYHSASFGVFLLLLILASTNVGSSGDDQALRQQKRGPPPTTLEWLIVFYVMGENSSFAILRNLPFSVLHCFVFVTAVVTRQSIVSWLFGGGYWLKSRWARLKIPNKSIHFLL